MGSSKAKICKVFQQSHSTICLFLFFRYLYIYYLPSGLFVVVSWVSFLIPPEVVPGRMALLVTLFLVLINIFNTITNVSPNTEGMTAIASWMIACMFFVFGALLAYATILYFLLVSSLDPFFILSNHSFYDYGSSV